MNEKRTGVLTPAVTYIRCSSQQQADTSEDQQRKELQVLAKEAGYKIIREYAEAPNSGDTADQRPQFLQMLADAEARGDFRVILAWEPERIGRFDMNEAGYRFYPIQRAGVVLHTKTKGLLKWDSLDLIISAWQARQEQRTRVARTNRSCKELSQQGKMVAGVPPFGYVRAGTRKNYHYEPHPQEAAIVRELFERNAAGTNAPELCEWINGLGFKTRRGNDWQPTVLRRTLQNRAYLGIIERKSDGSRHSDEKWHVVATGAHEPLIDQATFDSCQDRRRKQPTSTRTDYTLTGMCVCPGCKKPMQARKNSKGERSYVCRTYQENRSCERYLVDEKPLVEQVACELRRELLKAESEGRFQFDWDAFRESHSARAASSQKRIARLDGELARMKRNLALADPDMLPHIQDAIRDKEQERRAAAREQPAGDVNEQIELEQNRLRAAIHALLGAGELVKIGDAKALNRLFRNYNVMVYPNIERERYGKRKARNILRGGTVTAAFPGISPEFLQVGDALLSQHAGNTPDLLKVAGEPSSC